MAVCCLCLILYAKTVNIFYLLVGRIIIVRGPISTNYTWTYMVWSTDCQVILLSSKVQLLFFLGKSKDSVSILTLCASYVFKHLVRIQGAMQSWKCFVLSWTDKCTQLFDCSSLKSTHIFLVIRTCVESIFVLGLLGL